MTDCMFCRIAAREIPSSIIYEDEKILAFNDIAPQAPTHILIIPKEHSSSFTDLKDFSVVGEIYRLISKLTSQKGIDRSGFRVVVNHGKAAGQAVPHLHFHLLGGRDFSWPPG